MKMIRFTKEGLSDLKNEQAQLIKDRPAAVLDLKKARDMGDLKENGYYRSSKSKLVDMDRRLSIIATTLKQAYVVDVPTDAIGIGNTIVLQDEEKEIRYTIVGDLEANPREGKISLLSPLGKSVEGKNIGDTITLLLPAGTKTFVIKDIL